MVLLPFSTNDSVAASVKLTVVDRFTEAGENASLSLTDEDIREFGGQKRNLNGSLVFYPAKYEFIGKKGSEGDSRQYTKKYWSAKEEFGP